MFGFLVFCFFPRCPSLQGFGVEWERFFLCVVLSLCFFFNEEAPESESVSHKRPSLVCFSPFV